MPPAAVIEEIEENNKSGRGRKETETKEDTQECNPNDPKWRPPGSALGNKTDSSNNIVPPTSSNPRPSAPATEPSSRTVPKPSEEAPSKASRDREARKIIEDEMQRVNKAVARLEQEVSQGGTTAKQALERMKRDQLSLQAELSRLNQNSNRQ